MSHLNYNHLYYFWMVNKKGSVTKAAETLCLTPQTITGQIRAFEERLNGAVFKRNGRKLEPTELGELVFRYADKMFALSYEMLDVLNYRQDNSVLFEVGVADALSKTLVGKVLMSVMPLDGTTKIACYEATHEGLMERLRAHKLDVILSDCAGDSLKYTEILSKKLGESDIAFFYHLPMARPFPACLLDAPLLIPSKKSSLGQQLYQWFDELDLSITIAGEFDDAAMMREFGYMGRGIFVAPAIYTQDIVARGMQLLGTAAEIKEEYHLIFAERMIQHPSVKLLLNSDFTGLFSGHDSPI
ncbi:transcriptional activator NhaR [Shewanella avicenniae]|uniref:Transcriptional activator NhaR n=1 Tax=Shewanella avicenniae TaxID=2814294 RepID=A0ABX7QVQ1_9GAMM|nr:transcriptional activator NhaR [Shewanella avicenniae]QSX34703.1 transcriptional activator NhaR [Shewanella avicenniae]